MVTFCVFNDFCVVSFHDSDTGVCSSKINSNDAKQTNKKVRCLREVSVGVGIDLSGYTLFVHEFAEHTVLRRRFVQK